MNLKFKILNNNIRKKRMERTEVWNFIIALLVLTFVIGFSEFTIESFLYAFLMAFILLFVFVLSEKIIADQLGCKIKIKLWNFRRYWIRWQDKLDWDFPAWIVMPLILILISNGILKFTAILTFATRTTKKRVTKKFYEIKEFEFALIAASGIFATLVLALITKLFGFNEFASVASWFALLNLLPLGNLNGTKIFFGSKLLWIFLSVLTIIILILINLAHLVSTIFIALILAAIAAIIFYYFYEK